MTAPTPSPKPSSLVLHRPPNVISSKTRRHHAPPRSLEQSPPQNTNTIVPANSSLVNVRALDSAVQCFAKGPSDCARAATCQSHCRLDLIVRGRVHGMRFCLDTFLLASMLFLRLAATPIPENRRRPLSSAPPDAPRDSFPFLYCRERWRNRDGTRGNAAPAGSECWRPFSTTLPAADRGEGYLFGPF